MKELIAGMADGLVPCIFVVAILLLTMLGELDARNDELSKKIDEIHKKADICIAETDKCIEEMSKQCWE